MKIYIAGKITGDQGYRRFSEAVKEGKCEPHPCN